MPRMRMSLRRSPSFMLPLLHTQCVAENEEKKREIRRPHGTQHPLLKSMGVISGLYSWTIFLEIQPAPQRTGHVSDVACGSSNAVGSPGSVFQAGSGTAMWPLFRNS